MYVACLINKSFLPEYHRAAFLDILACVAGDAFSQRFNEYYRGFRRLLVKSFGLLTLQPISGLPILNYHHDKIFIEYI